MKPVRGIITHWLMPDGVPRPARLSAGGGEVWAIEIIRGTDGSPVMLDLANGRHLTVEDMTPGAQLRVTEPPGDDEGRELLDALVAQGLPLADSPLTGNA